LKVYPIPMVPGPVQVPKRILEAYLTQYGSPDLESDYRDLYLQTQTKMQQLMGTKNQIAFMTGEGMISLWGSLKSTIKPGDRVLTLGTGVFGYGIGDLARSIGAEVETVGFEYDETLHDWERIEAAIINFKPKMITVVHCETPSGSLNPMERLGELKKKHNVPLLYADMVASIGGVEVRTDDWQVDLALGGSQKALSLPCDISFVAVSSRAWEVIREVKYPGYDALLPFDQILDKDDFPYTPHWHGMAAMYTSLNLIQEEGFQAVYQRHEKLAENTRRVLLEIGYKLFLKPSAISSPTVTAVNVPSSTDWQTFDNRLRAEGLVVGGSYGPLAGKVFRIGHMGAQSNQELLDKALKILRKIYQQL
jgi:aspartate aminotransferase-like enzyme